MMNLACVNLNKTRKRNVLMKKESIHFFELIIKELSRILGTSSQNAKKTVNILVKKEYVELKKDKEDNRNLRIAMTKEGKEYYEERVSKESEYLDNLFADMDNQNLKELYENLQLLSTCIKKKEEEN